MKKRIKLTENRLNRIIKQSVKKTLKESLYNGDNYYEYEEIIERLNSTYDEYEDAISELQEWYLSNMEEGYDMHSSYAGKYGDEAKRLLRESYNRLGSMLNVEEDY